VVPFTTTPEVFERYARKRDASAFDPNHVMEEPAVLAELGSAGLRVIDLGCGYGAFGAMALSAGAADYLGIDGSRTMIEDASRRLAGTTNGRVELGDLEDYTAASGSADLVTCRLALQYVEDVRPVMDAVAHCLTPGGRFVMTAVHPVITSPDNWPDGPRTSWTVDHYLEPGPRTRPWFGSETLWHHRTVEQYAQALLHTGLTLTARRECAPIPTRCADEPGELARRRRVPLYLLLRGDGQPDRSEGKPRCPPWCAGRPVTSYRAQPPPLVSRSSNVWNSRRFRSLPPGRSLLRGGSHGTRGHRPRRTVDSARTQTLEAASASARGRRDQ